MRGLQPHISSGRSLHKRDAHRGRRYSDARRATQGGGLTADGHGLSIVGRRRHGRAVLRHRALLTSRGLLEADYRAGQGPELDQKEEGCDEQTHKQTLATQSRGNNLRGLNAAVCLRVPGQIPANQG